MSPINRALMTYLYHFILVGKMQDEMMREEGLLHLLTPLNKKAKAKTKKSYN